MGDWQHRKTEPSDVRGLCVVCYLKPQQSDGHGKYKPTCTMCHKYRFVRAYRINLKDSCEACGFVPINKCQLDIDHKDGNRKNNNLENLRTLCANCHRLKTFEKQDYFSRYPDH